MKTYNWEGVNPDDYYPLSLHDALPICFGGANTSYPDKFALIYEALRAKGSLESRSEEHTSELQSHHELVCRLLLEKKKSRNTTSLNSRFKRLDTLKAKIISATFRRLIRTNHKKASKSWRNENIQLGGCES